MTEDDVKVEFHNSIDFADAALMLWTSVRFDVPPNELIDFVTGENFVILSDELTTEEKVTAFDFLVETNSFRNKIAGRIQSVQLEGLREMSICWLLVDGVVFGDLTKTEAIARAVSLYSKAKSARRDDPSLSFMFKIANNRQLEAIWAKYKRVLHYAPLAAIDSLADELRDEADFQKKIDRWKDDPEQSSQLTLRVLRNKGLVDTAFVVSREGEG